MDEKRIDDLVFKAYAAGNEKEVRAAIITAINETKEDDSALCGVVAERMASVEKLEACQGAIDCADAILASKIKP